MVVIIVGVFSMVSGDGGRAGVWCGDMCGVGLVGVGERGGAWWGGGVVIGVGHGGGIDWGIFFLKCVQVGDEASLCNASGGGSQAGSFSGGLEFIKVEAFSMEGI